MGIGSMRDRVIFKEPVNTSVPGAGWQTTYQTSFEDWTKIEPLTSNRTLQDSQIQLQDGFRFNIRYRDTPQPNKSMLVEYEGRDYTINSIVEVNERKRYWQIVAVTDGTLAPEETT